jgi:hypothetical protein
MPGVAGQAVCSMTWRPAGRQGCRKKARRRESGSQGRSRGGFRQSPPVLIRRGHRLGGGESAAGLIPADDTPLFSECLQAAT